MLIMLYLRSLLCCNAGTARVTDCLNVQECVLIVLWISNSYSALDIKFLTPAPGVTLDLRKAINSYY